jgi:hypothetical protein
MLQVKLEDQQFLSPKFFNLPCEFGISSFSQSTAIDQMDQYFLYKKLSDICSYATFKRLGYVAQDARSLHRFMV